MWSGAVSVRSQNAPAVGRGGRGKDPECLSLRRQAPDFPGIPAWSREEKVNDKHPDQPRTPQLRALALLSVCSPDSGPCLRRESELFWCTQKDRQTDHGPFEKTQRIVFGPEYKAWSRMRLSKHILSGPARPPGWGSFHGGKRDKKGLFCTSPPQQTRRRADPRHVDVSTCHASAG
ncbi:unnamed protein product [Lota lota]